MEYSPGTGKKNKLQGEIRKGVRGVAKGVKGKVGHRGIHLGQKKYTKRKT